MGSSWQALVIACVAARFAGRGGLAALLAVTVAVSVGATDVPLRALWGARTRGEVLLLPQIRLPRVVAGLLTGEALGVAGCLTQTLARNRLATPDVVAVKLASNGQTVVMVLHDLASAARYADKLIAMREVESW